MIVGAEADYLLSAKGNQEALMNDIAEYVHDTKLRATMDSITRTEKGHGRKERRSAYTSTDVSWQPGGRIWPELKCIGALHTRFETSKGVTEEKGIIIFQVKRYERKSCSIMQERNGR